MFGNILRRLFGKNKSPQARIYRVTADYECIPVGEDLRCKGVEKLNPLQSCVKTNYNPDNHCVVVGKLGSGKSLIAFIVCNCFLHIGKKAVFTAPTRELTRELYELAVGIFGRQLAGLYNGSDRSVDGKVIVVSTPEGYLSGLRGNREWATGAELLIVDEAHNICHPSRGASLDAAITMFRLRGGKVLLMSGTFPQARDVSEHLHADLFLSEYERTKIIRREIVAPDDLEARVKPKVITESMVVTGTGYVYNKYSVRVQELRKILAKEEGSFVIVFVPLIIQGHCLSHALGAPFHWRGADEDEKREMMAGFRGGSIKTIIATDTLGQGVNTPCDVTVIFGGRRGGYLLDSVDVRQKEGRGGRNKDRAKSFLIGDQWELFHMKKEVYAKTMPLPTEAVLLTLLSMKNCSKEEIISALLYAYASRLTIKSKVVEAVGRYLKFLHACNLLAEKNGEYRLTEEGTLLARFFISPSEYMGYVKLARKLYDSQIPEEQKGCILLSPLIQSLPANGCPARLEKDFQMSLIKLQLDKELSASKAGNLRHYLEKPSAIPEFLAGCTKDLERWLGLLSDMERYKVHRESPGKKWMEDLVVDLKANILKMMARKKSNGPVQLTLVKKPSRNEAA